MTMLRFASIIICLSQARSFTPTTNPRSTVSSLASTTSNSGDGYSVHEKYKTDINMLNELLDSKEEAKFEEVKKIVQEIQELRRQVPEVALPQKVREALASYHNAEKKYGADSREAKVAFEYFVDISHAQDLHPDRHLNFSSDNDIFQDALSGVHVLDELKEIAHVEKAILDRFGTTDFEIGEGLLEREIGRDDDDTYGLWV